MKIFRIISVSLVLLAIFTAAPLYAQTNNPPAGGGVNVPTEFKIPNPFKTGNDLFGFIDSLINNIILPLGGMIAVLAFIYSGFLYVTAQGDQAKLATAHKALLYTAIGTAILLGAVAISKAISTTIDQLKA